MLDANYQGEGLVFLVGCPRSGTTWLQRLLASSPQVRTGQESHVFNHFVGPAWRRWKRFVETRENDRGGIGPGCYHTEEQFRAILSRFMLDLLEPLVADLPPGSIFLEKTPGHALFMDDIAEFLPQARFVHLIRDPRDVTASLLAVARSWGSHWAPDSAAKAAGTWVRHVKAARAAGKKLGPERYLEVRYEDLYRDGVKTLAGVFGFLGIAADTPTLEGWIAANRPERARTGAGTPIPVGGAFNAPGSTVKEPEGFVRSGKPGSGSELTVAQRLRVWRVARKTMRELGYPSDLAASLRG